MIDAIIRFSLRNRAVVLVAAIGLVGYGSYLAATLPIDLFPDLDRPRVVVITECPGLATEEAETLVTQPIEIAVLGAGGVRDVRSQTTAGLSVITVDFDWTSDIRAARQTIQERLATLTGLLPDGIRPQMTPTASIMGQIVIAGMHERPDARATTAVSGSGAEPAASDSSAQLTTQMELRTIADWVVRPRLRKIPGVAEVFVQGGERKQYQILVEPAALLEYGVSLEDVEQALAASNINTSGGFATEGEGERPIRILGRLGPDAPRVIDDLKRVPVKASDVRPVLLAQVAKVVEGPQPKRGDGGINGLPGVVFTIAKQPHADTRALTEKIEEAFDELRTSLPDSIVLEPGLFRLRSFIDRGIHNITESLAIGAGLVVLVLFLFLLNLRTTFITLLAIPLSLVITAVVFRLYGVVSGTALSINVMTLGGIAVAMGELVDDAIVDVENIFRRLSQNNAAAHPRPAIDVVYEASREIRSAIVFGTAVVVLVFLPLFVLSGVEGRLFAPLGIAYIVSILASLVVSVTLTPVLASYLLPASRATHHAGDSPLLAALKRLAAPLVRLSMALPGLLLVASWLAMAWAGFELSRLGRNFLPQFDEGSIQVNVSLPPGSSLAASSGVTRTIDAQLAVLRRSETNPTGEILSFVRRTGRAELDEHAMPVSSSEYILAMNPDTVRDRDAVLADLLSTLRRQVPGVDIEVEQPLAHLISHMISGVYAQIAIKVHGDDLDELLAIAGRIKQSLGGVAGLTPPVIEPIREADELHIRLKPEELARHGLTRQAVADVMQTALQGRVVSQVLEGQRRFDLLVRLEDRARNDFANLGRLRIELPGGQGQVELGTLAELGDGVGPSSVNRENARRRIVIRCNTQGRDLAGAVAEIRRTLDKSLQLPEGYFLEYGGQFESQARATAMLGGLAAVSVVGMYLVLLALFPSHRLVLQILNALPTAFVGGVAALVLTGQSLSVASLVGFISLGGIAVRNGILLVTHYMHLMQEEGEPFSRDLVMRGSLERLAPVLMTALTAGIGLVPLVVAGLEPGREILYPVATVILGGLVTSTFCEFLIHPGLFWRFSGRDADRLLEKPGSPALEPALEPKASIAPGGVGRWTDT